MNINSGLKRLKYMIFCNYNRSLNSKCILSKGKNSHKKDIAYREQDLLQISEKIMTQQGFSKLTMDKLVSACKYSKGTVYNHFNSKEDLLLALCIKGIQLCLQITKRALTFNGNSREKCLAIYFANRIHALTYPTLFFCILTGKTPAIQEKACSERLKKMNFLEIEMTKLCDQIFVDALHDKSLSLDEGVSTEHLSFATYAMSFGSNALNIRAIDVKANNYLDTEIILLSNVNPLMDGMNWKPLTHQWDYKNTWKRIGDEIFSKEIAALLI